MKAGFIGIGSMGGMLVRALLRVRSLAPEDVWAGNRSRAKLDALAADHPGVHLASNDDVAARCDLIFLCVAATDTAAVLAQIDTQLSSEQLLLTTAAAIPLEALENRVPCRVARLIPSITQEVEAGVALLTYGSRVSPENRRMLEELLGRISRPIAISETMARPAVGLTSGGPALLAYVLKAMAEEAARSNPELAPELSRQLVQETARATLKLLSEANMTGEEIIRRVAVPGGMTAMAIDILSHYLPQAWQIVFRQTAERENRARESLVL